MSPLTQRRGPQKRTDVWVLGFTLLGSLSTGSGRKVVCDRSEDQLNPVSLGFDHPSGLSHRDWAGVELYSVGSRVNG